MQDVTTIQLSPEQEAANPNQRRDIVRFLRQRVAEMTTPRTKHGRLMASILSAIEKGTLRPGDQLPPEPELASGTGLSLGTVRRCLTRLADEGIVSREHGRGTFIAGGTQALNELWHYRFLAEDGAGILPVYQRVLSQDLIAEEGPWSVALGASARGYIRVGRAVNVDNRFLCHSEFYVAADRFPTLLDAAPEDLEAIGMKHVLAMRYHVPIVRIAKTIECVPVPPDVAAIVGLDTGERVMRLKIVGYTRDDTAVSYQSMWIPLTEVPLDIATGPGSNGLRKGQEQ
jgi:DNA-binding GntR family transcriptional regulator